MDDIELRDFFAARATEEDIRRYIPNTIGDVASLLVELGWITEASMRSDVVRCYSEDDVTRLRCWARYQHAEDMLQARVHAHDRR